MHRGELRDIQQHLRTLSLACLGPLVEVGPPPPSHCCTNTRVAVAGNGRPSNPVVWALYLTESSHWRSGREICCQKAGTVIHLTVLNFLLVGDQQRKGGGRQGSFTIRAARVLGPEVQTSASDCVYPNGYRPVLPFSSLLRFSQFRWTEEFRLGNLGTFRIFGKYPLFPNSWALDISHWALGGVRSGISCLFDCTICRRWPTADRTELLRHPEPHRAHLYPVLQAPDGVRIPPLHHTDGQAGRGFGARRLLRDMPGTA